MKSVIFKLIYNLRIASILRNAKSNKLTVLCLHRISKEKDFFFDPIDPETFELLIKYCLKYYEVISFNDINKKTKKPKLILSFDDGYYDFIEYAIPILNKYNLPSNNNLVNICLNNGDTIWTQKLNDIFNYLKINSLFDDDLIEKYGKTFKNCKNNWYIYYISFFQYLLNIKINERDEIINKLVVKYNILSKHRMLNWEDAKNCINNFNVDIGCHSYNHDILTTIDNDKGLDYEIGNSIKEMEIKLNKKIDILSLPNGQWNKKVLDYCKRTNIKWVLLAEDETNPLIKINDKFNLINRIYLVNETIEETILRSELFHYKIKKIL